MKKQTSLLHATLSVSVLAILCKLLGFAREALIAAYYGATAETDAFFFAHGMPSMIFPTVGTSFAMTFTSIYIKRTAEEGEVSGDRYASRMLAATSLLGILLGLVGIAVSPVLVPLLAPGFSGSQLTLAVHLTRLIMGAFVLNMLQYMLGAVLNSKKLFIGSQVAALLYNASIITVTALLGQGQGMDTLMITMILGMAIQVFTLAGCCKGHFHYTLRTNPFHRDTRILVSMTLPVLLGNSVEQLNYIVDKALSSTLSEGALSALSYAKSLDAMVISVFVVSLSTVLYPTLTGDAAIGDMERYGATLLQSLSGLCLLLVPISCITVLSAGNIVEIVYARGRFNQSAVELTATALACYAPRFALVGIWEVLIRAFFAVQDTKTPMRNSAIGMGCNIVFSLIFVRWLGIAGIALGTVAAAVASAALLLWDAHRKLPALPLPLFFRNFGKQLLAGAVLSLSLLLFHRFVPIPWALLRFAADTLLGFFVYFLSLLALGSQDLRTFIGIFRKKFFH